MQIEIHQCQATRTSDKILTEIGLGADAFGIGALKYALADFIANQPLIGTDRKPPVPHAGSQTRKSGMPRGSGFVTRQMV